MICFQRARIAELKKLGQSQSFHRLGHCFPTNSPFIIGVWELLMRTWCPTALTGPLWAQHSSLEGKKPSGRGSQGFQSTASHLEVNWQGASGAIASSSAGGPSWRTQVIPQDWSLCFSSSLLVFSQRFCYLMLLPSWHIFSLYFPPKPGSLCLAVNSINPLKEKFHYHHQNFKSFPMVLENLYSSQIFVKP